MTSRGGTGRRDPCLQDAHGRRRDHLLGFGVVLVTSGVLVTSLAAQTVVGVVGSLLPVDSALMVVLDGVVRSLGPLAAPGAEPVVLFVLLPRHPVDRRAAVMVGGITAVVAALGVSP